MTKHAMTSNNNHFIFSLLRYLPLTIRLLIHRHGKHLFSSTPQDKKRQFAELIGFTLRLFGVKVTDYRLHELVEISPHHLSTDATESVPFLLEQWNIQATVGILDNNAASYDDNLSSLTLPCLIRLDNGEPATILSLSKTNRYLLLYRPENGITLISKEALDTIWSGFFFTIDTDSSLQQPLYSEQITKEFWGKWRLPLIALLCGLLIVISLTNQLLSNSGASLVLWLSVGLCLLSGLSLSAILAQHSMGNNGGLLASLCSNDSNHSCRDILDSPKAKLFGIPHADIGVAYFSGAFAVLSISSTIPWLVASLSVFTLCYSLYSFIFQRYIIAQWCRLCLAVQAVIIIQALITVITFGQLYFLPSTADQVITALIIFILPGLLWATIRHSIITEKSSHELEQQFKALLIDEEKIQLIENKRSSRSSYSFTDDENSDDIDDEHLESDMILGTNNDQDLRVTIGLSPSCHHCGIFLEEMIQFIQSKHWPITLRIRLIIDEGYDQENINDRTLAEHITALTINDGFDVAIKALCDWYQTFKAEDIKAWQASIRNITDDEINDVSILLADISYWVSQNNINAMPALFIEGEYIPYVSAEYSTILLRKLCLL